MPVRQPEPSQPAQPLQGTHSPWPRGHTHDLDRYSMVSLSSLWVAPTGFGFHVPAVISAHYHTQRPLLGHSRPLSGPEPAASAPQVFPELSWLKLSLSKKKKTKNSHSLGAGPRKSLWTEPQTRREEEACLDEGHLSRDCPQVALLHPPVAAEGIFLLADGLSFSSGTMPTASCTLL